MPRKKISRQEIIFPLCQCEICSEGRAKFGDDIDYCIRCARVCPPNGQEKLCPTCGFCRNCRREYHYRCEKPECRKSLCHQDTGVCLKCYRCSEVCCECINCKKCGNKTPVSPEVARGCLKCKLCFNCGRCKCWKKEQFSILIKSKKEYKDRTSIADLILRDGTVINKARVAFHQSSQTEFKWNSLKRCVSVEMEIAGLTPGPREGYLYSPLQMVPETLAINTIVGKWRANLVEDMSLPGYGFEINTAPANGDRFTAQIEEIVEVLSQFGATVKNNYDGRKRQMCCGLHVHADARDFFYTDMQKFLLLYEHIEEAIYSMLPGYRRGSHFAQKCGKKYGQMVRACVPIPPGEKKNSPDPVKQGLITTTYQKNLPDRSGKRVCPQETRYRSVNLHQYFYRGTIEFRHYPGTVDKDEIINWAILVGAILDFSQKTSHKILKEAIGKYSSVQLLLKIGETVNRTDKVDLPYFITGQMLKFAENFDENESPLLGEIEIVPQIRQAQPARENDLPVGFEEIFREANR